MRAEFDKNSSLPFEQAKVALLSGEQILKKYENPVPFRCKYDQYLSFTSYLL